MKDPCAMTDPETGRKLLTTTYYLCYGTLSSVRRVAELPCEHAV
jgi:hypothetical protein